LESGVVRMLLISEQLDLVEASVSCATCNHLERVNLRQPEVLKFETEVAGKACPKCGNISLQVAEKKDLIDVLTEMAEHANVDVEVISASHEEGEMLIKSFGGVAALLRYKG